MVLTSRSPIVHQMVLTSRSPIVHQNRMRQTLPCSR
jgi:hypothetical protein